MSGHVSVTHLAVSAVSGINLTHLILLLTLLSQAMTTCMTFSGPNWLLHNIINLDILTYLILQESDLDFRSLS